MGVPERRLAAAVAGTVAVLAMLSGLAGCTKAPAVGDGSLGVDWAVLPSPTVSVPAAGTCTTAEGQHHTVEWMLGFLPGTLVDCAGAHLLETYYVGTFPPDVDTDPNTVPTVGTARFRSAYTDCAQRAVEFLGADPHSSRLVVLPVMPSDRQWAGQARWFRCELMEIGGLDRSIVNRTQSLRDALAGVGPLTTTCADVVLDAEGRNALEVGFVPCEESHDVEVVGAFTMPDGDYPDAARRQQLSRTACPQVGAEYVGVTASELMRAGSDVYTFAADLTEEQWSAGERTTWCFYGSFSETYTGSIKDLGAFPYTA